MTTVVASLGLIKGFKLEIPLGLTRFSSTKVHQRANLIINHLNAELNPICHLLALAGAHHFVDISRIRVKGLNFVVWILVPSFKIPPLHCRGTLLYPCRELANTLNINRFLKERTQ
jgi:hypothetical protein